MPTVSQIGQIYRCNICGNIVEVIHVGTGELVCCDQPMELLLEKKEDVGLEKHVPVIEGVDNGFRVTVGSMLHPMTADHYIEWIQITADGTSYRKYLLPGDEPITEFIIKAKEISAREYCNLHGLWSS